MRLILFRLFVGFVLLTLSVMVFVSADLNDNLIAAYKFENDLIDELGSYNLTEGGTMNYQAGVDGQEAVSDGNDFGYMSGQQPLAAADVKTFSFWVNITSMAGYPTFYSTRNGGTGFWFQVKNDGILQYSYIGRGNADSADSININTQYHIAIVFVSASNITFYIDGVNAGLGPNDLGTPILSSGSNTDIMAQQGTGTYPGTIDEFYVYDRALTSDEITTLASNTPAGFYPFEEGNCWSDESWGIFIPKGCVYFVNKGVVD